MKKIFPKADTNLLNDPYFSKFNCWRYIDADCNCDFIVHPCTCLEGQSEELQQPVLRLYSYATFEGRGLFQEINNLSTGKYIYEVNLSVWKECFGTKHSGVYLKVISGGKEIAKTKHFSHPNQRFFNLRLPFELAVEQTVQVQLCLDGVGTVYVKNAKLRKSF